MSRRLLKGNLSSLSLKLSLEILSLCLRSSLLENLRCSLNGLLSFLKAKTSSLTYNLDNLDLVRTNISKLYVELSLLLSRSCSSASSNNNTCSSRYAKLFLNSLYKVIKLYNGKLLDSCDKLFCS